MRRRSFLRASFVTLVGMRVQDRRSVAAAAPQSTAGTWALRGTTLLDGAVTTPVTDFKDVQGWGEQARLAVDGNGVVYCTWVHNASPEANGGPSDGATGFQSTNPGAARAINTSSLRVKRWSGGQWQYV